MKIKFNWSVTQAEGVEIIDLSDVNCQSEEEWYDLTFEEQRKRIQGKLDTMPERIYLAVTLFQECQKVKNIIVPVKVERAI